MAIGILLASKTFGQWVTMQREAQRLSKSECAKRAGVSIQRWAQVEYDESRRKDQSPPQVGRNTVRWIAKGLDVSLVDAFAAAGLLPDEEPNDIPPALLIEKDEHGREPDTPLSERTARELIEKLDQMMKIVDRAQDGADGAEVDRGEEGEGVKLPVLRLKERFQSVEKG